MSSDRHPKPPIGVMPRWMWIENRTEDILNAMEKFRAGKYIIPTEWVEELAEHLRTIQERRDEQ